jgi:hypothetical protein
MLRSKTTQKCTRARRGAESNASNATSAMLYGTQNSILWNSPPMPQQKRISLGGTPPPYQNPHSGPHAALSNSHLALWTSNGDSEEWQTRAVQDDVVARRYLLLESDFPFAAAAGERESLRPRMRSKTRACSEVKLFRVQSRGMCLRGQRHRCAGSDSEHVTPRSRFSRRGAHSPTLESPAQNPVCFQANGEHSKVEQVVKAHAGVRRLTSSAH